MANYIFGDSSQVQFIATETILAAEGYINKLGNLALQLQPPVINPVFPVNTIPPAISVPPVPATQTIVWTAPTVPAPFTGSLDVRSLFPGPLTATPPTLNFPTPPLPGFGNVPPSPAVQLDFTFPSLDLSLPSPPSLLNLSVVPFAGLLMPTAPSQNIPQLTIAPPGIIPYTPGARYTSALLTDLEAQLDARIVSGTNTGLPPAVEQALWDRGREREYRSQADALAELDGRMEALGYAFPPGVWLDARIKLQTETQYTVAGFNREVMIKQAELVQSNIIAALAEAVRLETMQVGYTNQIEQRIFESTKYATEAGIAIYNAQVHAYTAFLEAYKTKVQIYDAQVRGAIATVEVYKTQIQAEELKARINTELVQQYKVTVDAQLALVEVYKAEISAIQIQADIQKIKVQIFGEQVRAYASSVNAFTAQVEAYRAQIQSQQALEEVYKTQVDAYSAIVGAAMKEAEALISQYRGAIEEKTMEYEAYKSIAIEQAEAAKAIAQSNQSVAAIYSATVQGTSAYNETLTKAWQVALDEAERVTEIGVQAAKANAELYMTVRSLALDAAKVGAQVNAQLGAAALGAINWSTHETFSTSVAQNQNQSVSSGSSTSYVYNTSNITEDITSA